MKQKEMDSMKRRILPLILALAMLLNCLPTVFAADAKIVLDGNTMEPFASRTKEEIGSRYAAARNAGVGYVNNDRTTYYSVQPSLSAPYAAGVLADDTQAVMNGMTDFYRWLVGVRPFTSPSKNQDSLQKGALVRNWEFNHSISSNSKPADMEQALWDEGAAASHNILAMGYTPRGAISGWLNEGYDLRTGQWDTLGHRNAILYSSYTGVDYGYCGSIAIGKITGYDNSWGNNAFAAYPAPGYMPMNELSVRSAAWSVELNTAVVRCTNSNNLTVRVTNLGTGDSYDCTRANGKLTGTSNIGFVQPDCGGNTYADGDRYQVEITGLTETATGKDAKIVYTVNFFDVRDYADTYVTGASPNGWKNLLLTERNSSPEMLQTIAAILPKKVAVQTESGKTIQAAVAGSWTLDQENSCWHNKVNASELPDHITDRNNVLQDITVTYQVVDYTGSFSYTGGTPYAEAQGGFRMWRYMVSTDCAELYQIDRTGGVTLRYDRNSPNFQAEDSGYYTWSHDWQMTDSGIWCGIYYSSSTYFQDAYLAGICDVTVSCKHGRTHTVTVNPTCSQEGSTATVCDICGETLAVDPIAKLPHTWDAGTRTSEPDCVTPGELQRHCTVCGAEKTEPIPALGHDYQAAVTEPTCTEKGYTTHTCTRCGDTYVDTYIDTIAHTWGEWNRSKDPTCEEAGEENHTCAVCGKTESRKVEALGHDWGEWVITKEATENEAGEQTHTCNRCGKTEIGETAKLPCPSAKFVDVNRSAWYHNAIDFAITHNIFSGIDDTHFNPNGKTTRAMFVAVLWRLAGQEIVDAENPFVDVKATTYYAKAVTWAAQNSIVAGMDATHFNPTGNVTREQVAAFLYRYAASIHLDLTAEADLTAFPDADAVSPYAKKSVSWAVGNGFISGTKEADTVYLNPKGNATRAQVAQILMNFAQSTAK